MCIPASENCQILPGMRAQEEGRRKKGKQKEKKILHARMGLVLSLKLVFGQRGESWGLMVNGKR